MVKFGQLVIGPPGSGKTTYCRGMRDFMVSVGRKCEVVNLDFANDNLPYDCLLDVRDLIALENVMEDMKLGPNGALMYCMEFLLLHADWLDKRLAELLDSADVSCDYVIFDCPGQVELYTHHHSMETIVRHLEKSADFRLCSLYLVDSFYCIEPATFISASMIAAATMLRIALPHINVLSKIDLLPRFGKLPFPLEFYTDATDLSPLADYVNYSLEEVQATMARNDEEDEEGFVDEDENEVEDDGEKEEEDVEDDDDVTIDGDVEVFDGGNSKGSSNNKGEDRVLSNPSPNSRRGLDFKSFTQNLCSTLDDLGLVSFMPLAIDDPDTVVRVLLAVDKANGYSLVSQIAHSLLEKNKNSNNSKNKKKEGELGGGVAPDVGYASSAGANLWSFIAQDLNEGFDRYDILEKYTAKPSSSSSNSSSNSSSSSISPLK